MRLIKEEKIGTVVNDQQVWNFEVSENGVYVISISARCKNWLQNYKRLFNDDDLAVQIDDYLFAEIKGKKREFASSGSWNGNEIKNEIKNVLFVLPFKAGFHKIKFWVGEQPILEEIKIYKIEENEIDLITNEAARLDKFLDIVSKNLKTEKLEIKAKAEVGSKLEIKIDGKTEKNTKYKKFAKWYWYGQELKGKSNEYIMPDGLDDALHSLEFHGYGTPEIESIKLKIDLDNIVYSHGFVKLYKDIVIRDDVNLRSDHTDEGDSLMMLQDGEKVDILNERVVGRYITNYSKIWHEVAVRGTRGYILSSFVEIEGQEREKIIDLIKERCNQYVVDANIMIAIAGKESHFKPFARSFGGAKGIFQMFEDAMKDVGINDAYDFYQNIDGGVRYYKKIEKRIKGRGDILIKRLAAWHDGPTIITEKIKNKTFDYNKLSNETRSFIRNVQANLEKKDWYNIIYLPVIILFFISFHLFWQTLPPKQIIPQSQTADVINSNTPVDYSYNSEKIIKNSPNVFLEEINNQIIFINSKNKIVEKIYISRLDLDKILGVTEDVITPDWPNNPHISPVVLENPQNVFYFSATNSYSCGASNCNWVFYRFDSKKGELRVINPDIFGQVTEMYLSPDLENIAVVSNSEGGSCNSHSYLNIFNTTTFAKYNIDGFYDDKYGSQILENFVWKNNNEAQFNLSYFKCAELYYVKTTWLYNIYDIEIKKVDSKVVYQDL